MRLDISELVSDFPDFSVAAVIATGLSVTAGRSPAFDAFVANASGAARAEWNGTPLSEIPGIAVWRQAYRAFGVRKTSYRCSVERLMKNALAERPLPPINSFVDLYNACSLQSVMPMGADDLDAVEGDLAFRYSRPGDVFVDMAGGGEAEDPPKPGEVVYADGSNVLCRRWNWRQDARSVVRETTKRAVLTIQYNGVGDLGAVAEDFCGRLAEFGIGRADFAIAGSDDPVIDLPV